jgi:FKBP-type peptidyl-prolyl cis-trans isomerase SlyD
MTRAVKLAATLVALTASTTFAQTPSLAPGAVQNGSTVSLEYTLKDDGGQVLDSNKDGTPLVFVQGQRQIIAGLERELVGMRPGEEKKVVVAPDDGGYGPVVPGAQREVPKDVIPKEGLKVGTQLTARSGSGEPRPVTVKEIKDTTVVLDFNHPLAGKTLFFDVKVLDVQAPGKPARPSP